MTFVIRGGRKAAAAAVLLTIATGAQAAGRPDLVRDDLARGKPYMTGEVVVQFAPSATTSQRQAALARVGGQAAQRLTGDLTLARFPSAVAMERALERIGADSAVRFAEPNWIYQHAA